MPNHCSHRVRLTPEEISNVLTGERRYKIFLSGWYMVETKLLRREMIRYCISKFYWEWADTCFYWFISVWRKFKVSPIIARKNRLKNVRKYSIFIWCEIYQTTWIERKKKSLSWCAQWHFVFYLIFNQESAKILIRFQSSQDIGKVVQFLKIYIKKLIFLPFPLRRVRNNLPAYQCPLSIIYIYLSI